MVNEGWAENTWEGLHISTKVEVIALQLTVQRRDRPTECDDDVEGEDEKKEKYENATRLARTTKSLRYNLAQWVPAKLQGRKLELLYSTDVDGRSLDTLYGSCSFTFCGPTITLMEVLETGQILGMFSSQAWKKTDKVSARDGSTSSTSLRGDCELYFMLVPTHANKNVEQHDAQVYGDGTCFICQFHPEPLIYKWSPYVGNNEEVAILSEQFMMSNSQFIAMGGNADGANALKINDDLTIGWTEKVRNDARLCCEVFSDAAQCIGFATCSLDFYAHTRRRIQYFTRVSTGKRA